MRIYWLLGLAIVAGCGSRHEPSSLSHTSSSNSGLRVGDVITVKDEGKTEGCRIIYQTKTSTIDYADVMKMSKPELEKYPEWFRDLSTIRLFAGSELVVVRTGLPSGMQEVQLRRSIVYKPDDRGKLGKVHEPRLDGSFAYTAWDPSRDQK